MPRIFRTWPALVLTAVVLLGACTKNPGPPAGQLPEAGPLLLASAGALREVKSAHFVLDVRGRPAGIAVRHAEGSLTAAGDAKGTATLDQLGTTVEVEFVIVDQKVYLKGPTGGFQQVPLSMAASVYDPSAILDPQRGVAKLLAALKDARTEAKEPVGGQDAYRIAVTPAPGALDVLIPGVPEHTTGKLWIAADSKRLLKGEFTVPASGSDKGGTITITFTDFDAPVSITAP